MTSKGGLQIIKESKGESFCEAYKKPLEAIEKDLDKLAHFVTVGKELGMDLITLSEALKQKFVYHYEKVKIELLGLHIKSNELYLYGFVEDTTHAVYLSLKEYGKTWALTREELLWKQ